MNASVEQLKSAFENLSAVSIVLLQGAGRRQQVQEHPTGVRLSESELSGFALDVVVHPTAVVAAAEIADKFGFAIDTITGVDWIANAQMEVVYDFFHPQHGLHLVVRTRVPRDNPVLPSIQAVFPGANWHERETHDFFGITFVGHPDLKPLLLPEDANYHPLRKDFPNAGSNSS